MKKNIRKEMLEKLTSQEPARRLEKSIRIQKKLFQEVEFIRAQCVMFYVSMDGEVDTTRMIDESLEMGKRVCVPMIVEDKKTLIAAEIHNRLQDLEKGHYGIYQPKACGVRPVPLDDIDVIIVPGIIFDRNNMRMGRGRGYYDRFLCRLPHHSKTIGLAFDFQVVENLPVDPHDIPVDRIISA